MGYQLTYWAKRGRAEQIRLLLNELGEEYEDAHVSGDSFRALQAEGPTCLTFGQVPMLTDGELKLCQGPVIMSYLARKHGLAPADLGQSCKADALTAGAEDMRIAYFKLFGEGGAERQAAFVDDRWKNRWLAGVNGVLEANGTGFLVGDSLTHADIAMWDILDSITTWVAGADFTGFEQVQTFFDAIKARPNIAAYLGSDRRPKG